MSLVEKLVEVSKQIGFLEFDKNNQQYDKPGRAGKANYIAAATVIRKLNLELAARGLLAYVSKESVTTTEFTTTKGAKQVLATVTCELTFTDGQTSITACGSGSGMDAGDKAVMKASTAAYKYAIAHALSLGWDAVDPEEANPEHAEGPAPATTKPAKRAAKAKVEPAAAPVTFLLTRIQEAASEKDLDKLRDEVRKLKGDEFEKHKAAVVTRRGELAAAAKAA